LNHTSLRRPWPYGDPPMRPSLLRCSFARSFIVPRFLSHPDRLKECDVQFRRISALQVRPSCNRNPSVKQCLSEALLRAARGLDSSNQLAFRRFRCKIPESYALIATPGLVNELAEPIKTRGHLLPRGGEFVPESRLRKVENTRIRAASALLNSNTSRRSKA
jgi:hypothetical protein